jgi:type 1 glutamine amidotransferase
MVGAMFVDHAAPGQPLQTGTILVEDPAHPATAPLPRPWSREEEWYVFDRNPRDVARVLLTVDDSSFAVGPKACAPDHPLAWCRLFRGARVFYTALGHASSAFAEPAMRAHLRGALRWATKIDEADCTPRPAPAQLPAGNAACGAAACFTWCRCTAGVCERISGHDWPPPSMSCGGALCGAGCTCADANKNACACP